MREYNAESLKKDSKRFHSNGRQNTLPFWVNCLSMVHIHTLHVAKTQLPKPSSCRSRIHAQKNQIRIRLSINTWTDSNVLTIFAPQNKILTGMIFYFEYMLLDPDTMFWKVGFKSTTLFVKKLKFYLLVTFTVCDQISNCWLIYKHHKTTYCTLVYSNTIILANTTVHVQHENLYKVWTVPFKLGWFI